MKKFTVSAPGKLHLLGEHAVVYGKPAIIAAVNRRCYVSVAEQKEDIIAIELKNNIYKTTEKEILEKTKKAHKIWEECIKTNEIEQLKLFVSDPFDFIKAAIGETVLFYNKKLSKGFNLSIHSDIPIGSGMGSSAALAAAIAGAVSLFIGEKLDKEKINQIAFRIEQKKHGNPSGGDNSASCFGGLIWYQKKSEDEKIIRSLPFSVPQSLADKFVIIQTGIPEESTGEMVTKVKNQMSKIKNKFEVIFDDQEKLVYQLSSALENKDERKIIKIIEQGEKNLEMLGVVSESTKKLIRKIEKSGGAAKICGAGGRKKSSGIVLAFHSSPDKIKKICKEFDLSYSHIKLGKEGLRKEKYE